MSTFVSALMTYPFLQYAVLASLMASIACGIVGSYVVARRISYIAGAISHCVLGGMGAARYLAAVYHWEVATPLRGAIVAALISALCIGMVSLRAKQREDTVIGALWAVGMAVGILFISQTPGYNEDLMSYLFGNILMVSPNDLFLIMALDTIVVLSVGLWRNQLLAVCFDEEFARLRGIRTDVVYLLLLGLTALTVVLLVSVVGIVLVIALLTLPAAIAGHFARSLWQMMLLAIGCCALLTLSGLALSYGPNLPAGATIVVLAGAAYLATATLTTLMPKRRA